MGLSPLNFRLLETFGAGPSGGNVLVSARTLRSKRTQGALPKSRPLENPLAAPPEVRQNLSDCYGAFYCVQVVHELLSFLRLFRD